MADARLITRRAAFVGAIASSAALAVPAVALAAKVQHEPATTGMRIGDLAWSQLSASTQTMICVDYWMSLNSDQKVEAIAEFRKLGMGGFADGMSRAIHDGGVQTATYIPGFETPKY